MMENFAYEIGVAFMCFSHAYESQDLKGYFESWLVGYEPGK